MSGLGRERNERTPCPHRNLSFPFVCGLTITW
jgi:hypothetical protein